MIAKNEEKFLSGCLNSVKDLVDEIILVDTGSTDKTVDIAKSFGAKVFFQEWNDDFSRPRNESLRQATGDWIFLLDPDEKIATRDHERIKSLLSKKSAYMFKTRNYIYKKKGLSESFDSNDEYADFSMGMPLFWASNKVRLFPNNKNIEFCGAVHELVETSIEEQGLKIEKVDIPIHHYSQLDEERSRHKRFFYMNITRKKVLREPKNPKAHLELGREYFNLRIYHRAIQTFKKGLSLGGDKELMSRLSYEIGLVYMKTKMFSEAEQFFLKALGYQSTNINAATSLKNLYSELKNEKKVKEINQRIVGIVFELGKYQKVIDLFGSNISNPSIENFDTFYFLVKSYEQLEDKHSADKIRKMLGLKGLPILCYHDIGKTDSDWCINLDDFKEQVLFLRGNGYDFVTLDNLDYKKKCVALTFDDGRLSAYKDVLPFLEKYKLKANFFITTDWIEKKNTSVKEGYSDFMDWKHIKELSKKGHLIGSHTVTHKDMTFLNDEQIREELTLSKKILEEKTGVNIDVLCYPFGHYNQKIEILARETDYKKAVTVNFGFCKEDSLLMPRIYILRDTKLDTFKRLFLVF